MGGVTPSPILAAMKRRAPPFAIIVAVAAFIFAQLLGAVHACPVGLDGNMPVKAAAVSPMDGDCCDHGQPAPDPACDNHCQQAYKAPEPVQALIVAPLVAVGFVTPVASRAIADRPSNGSTAPHLARHTEPPISVRNCCFRI